jgi:GH24 family phage-related lysozyme (muramidase)
MFSTGDAVEYLKKHEGIVSHMYLDVAGLVTIGVGFLLPAPSAAVALALTRRDTGAPASAEEKSADWNAVHAQPKAQPAGRYLPLTSLEMPDAVIDSELSARIAAFARNLQSRFPTFAGFPDPVQLGLLDMIYSLGPSGLFRGFPEFCSAVDRQEWAVCAREGIRGNVSPTRNEELQQLFQRAAGLS